MPEKEPEETKKDKCCGTCTNYLILKVILKNKQKKTVRTECRCFPPQVVRVIDKDACRSVWPKVKEDDWCNQWAEGKKHVAFITEKARAW